MRDILYQNLTSDDKRRRDLFVQEMFEKNGIISCTQKKATYIIKKRVPFEDIANIDEWIKRQNQANGPAQRQIYILKTFNSKRAEEGFTCKIVGSLYAVADNNLYHIV